MAQQALLVLCPYPVRKPFDQQAPLSNFVHISRKRISIGLLKIITFNKRADTCSFRGSENLLFCFCKECLLLYTSLVGTTPILGRSYSEEEQLKVRSAECPTAICPETSYSKCLRLFRQNATAIRTSIIICLKSVMRNHVDVCSNERSDRTL